MGNPYFAIEFPVFKPAMRIIQDITNSNPASVTTTFAHSYTTGTIIRLDIPPGFGMQQANTLFASIVVTGTTTFNIDIDTSLFDTFLSFGSWPTRAESYPSAVPIGEDNALLNAAVQNVLPY